jgi:hypothetical protein
MDQVSRPVQVALIATLAFAVLWFLALRPKVEEVPPPPKNSTQKRAQGGKSALPGNLGNSVDQARAGQAQANQSAQQRQQQDAESQPGSPPAQPRPAPARPAPARPAPARSQARALGLFGRAVGARAGSPSYRAGVQFGQAYGRRLLSAGPAVSAPTVALGMLAITLGQANRAARSTPAAAPARTPRSAVAGAGASGGRRFASSVTPTQVDAALRSGKVVVLLFYNRLSSDDRAVRSELGSLPRRSGRVLVGHAPLREVSRFPSVTQGVQILQSPSVVVVNRRRQAQVLVGYTDRFEIEQRVANALAGR